MSNDLLTKLQAIVDASIVIIDAGDTMQVLRVNNDGGCEFLSAAGEWGAAPCELARLIVDATDTEEEGR